VTDLHPHRPEWVRWIPAVLLSVVILSAVLFAIIAGPRIAAGPGPAEMNQVTDLNWSVFTDDGLAFIESARTPRIDLSSPPVGAVELGLPADGALTVGPHATDLDYRLVLLGTDDEPNGALFVTPQFTVNASGGELVSVRIEQRGALDFRQTYQVVADRSASLGYTAPSASSLGVAVSEARDSGLPVIVRSDQGTSTGMGVVAEVTCFGAGFCQVSYLVTAALG
jgi:hypothetical protein